MHALSMVAEWGVYADIISVQISETPGDVCVCVCVHARTRSAKLRRDWNKFNGKT